VDLVRRTEGVTAHALATPLITTADGKKIGKTEGATVWLDPELTSPYAFFQYWLNVDDVDARAWLPLFSERPPEELDALLAESVERPAARAVQRALAEELTLMVHGPEELRQAEAAGRALFGRDDLSSLSAETLGAALREAGSTTVGEEVPTVAQLLHQTGLVSSLSEARRTVKEGGAYLNNQRVTDAEAVPGPDAWLPGGWLVLRRGRRTVAGVQRGTASAG
jgi:tyrosyl-tRNA synthetase